MNQSATNVPSVGPHRRRPGAVRQRDGSPSGTSGGSSVRFTVKTPCPSAVSSSATRQTGLPAAAAAVGSSAAGTFAGTAAGPADLSAGANDSFVTVPSAAVKVASRTRNSPPAGQIVIRPSVRSAPVTAAAGAPLSAAATDPSAAVVTSKSFQSPARSAPGRGRA